MHSLAAHPSKWARLALAGLIASAAFTGVVLASDHMDTPFVEANPRYDVNDVYAFPGSTPDRVALVLGTQSPITPAGTRSATFGEKNQVLYQLKVDNTGDAKEDLVFQFTFTGPAGHQKVRMQGPVKPNEVGTANTLVTGPREIQGDVGTVLGSPTGTQLFAGPRDDPFFIDLEAAFCVLPDRRPVSGNLSSSCALTPSQPGTPFYFRNPGLNYVAGFNVNSIVIELPTSMIEGSGPGRLGIWGTISQ